MNALYYAECPRQMDTPEGAIAVFLAGGITNCPDWQKDVYEILWGMRHLDPAIPDILLMNPRRKNFPIHDPNASQEQIQWEFDHFRQADIVSFWFSAGTVQPIVMYEYGYWLARGHKPLVLGVDPEYLRRADVEIQTMLHCDEQGTAMMMHTTLTDLCRGICEAAKRLREQEEA